MEMSNLEKFYLLMLSCEQCQSNLELTRNRILHCPKCGRRVTPELRLQFLEQYVQATLGAQSSFDLVTSDGYRFKHQGDGSWGDGDMSWPTLWDMLVAVADGVYPGREQVDDHTFIMSFVLNLDPPKHASVKPPADVAG